MSIERVKEEIEALEAIFMDDILIDYSDCGKPEKVTFTVLPSTADDSNKQFVCVTLEVKLPSGYPDIEPIVNLVAPRGLDDSTVNRLQCAITEKCTELIGQPVIFELVEIIRDHLTDSNLPRCQCAVCLYGFTDADTFTKTQCYHYFHSYCLALYWIHTEKMFQQEQAALPAWQKDGKRCQVYCPVCREIIICDVNELKRAPPPKELEEDEDFTLTEELQALQAKMKNLFTYQKRKGGIIDASKIKLLLIGEPASTNSNEGSSLNQISNVHINGNCSKTASSSSSS